MQPDHTRLIHLGRLVEMFRGFFLSQNQIKCWWEFKCIPEKFVDEEPANQKGNQLQYCLLSWVSAQTQPYKVKSLWCLNPVLFYTAHNLVTIIQDGKIPINWLGTYQHPSVRLLFTLAVWKSEVFLFRLYSAGEMGLLSSPLTSTAWDPLFPNLSLPPFVFTTS